MWILLENVKIAKKLYKLSALLNSSTWPGFSEILFTIPEKRDLD